MAVLRESERHLWSSGSKRLDTHPPHHPPPQPVLSAWYRVGGCKALHISQKFAGVPRLSFEIRSSHFMKWSKRGAKTHLHLCETKTHSDPACGHRSTPFQGPAWSEQRSSTWYSSVHKGKKNAHLITDAFRGVIKDWLINRTKTTKCLKLRAANLELFLLHAFRLHTPGVQWVMSQDSFMYFSLFTLGAFFLLKFFRFWSQSQFQEMGRD